MYSVGKGRGEGVKEGVTAAQGDDALGVRRHRLRWGVR